MRGSARASDDITRARNWFTSTPVCGKIALTVDALLHVWGGCLKRTSRWFKRWQCLQPGCWQRIVPALAGGLFAVAALVLASSGWWWIAGLVALSGGLFFAVLRRHAHDRGQLAELQQRIATLEHELAEARTAATAAARAKSAFLANISHELRTPLNTIIGYSELLHEDAQEGVLSPDRARTGLQRIRAAAGQLLNLINDMIELARLEAGDVAVSRERWPLSLLIEEVQRAILPLADEQNNRLFVELNVDPATVVEVDRVKVRQILLHLLQNAVKFTKAGEIRLTVAIREHSDEPALLTLSVSDTGIGMSKEQLDALFEPFTRFDKPLTPRYSGAGIGLAIAQRLCMVMGGTIAAMSHPGRGSTFLVTIPLVATRTPIAIAVNEK